MLLATQMEPPELETARGWYEQAAKAGDTGAMVNLGYLLTLQVEPPEPVVARRWLKKAAKAGNADGTSLLGSLLAVEGKTEKAVMAWREGLNTAAPEVLANAALNLAAVVAFEGNLEEANALLDLAQSHGVESAATYAAALSPDHEIRASSRNELSDRTEDTGRIELSRPDGIPSG